MLIRIIQAHPPKARLVRRWKGKQFPLFDRLGELIEGRYATGKYVVHAGAEAASSPVMPIVLEGEESDDDDVSLISLFSFGLRIHASCVARPHPLPSPPHLPMP